MGGDGQERHRGHENPEGPRHCARQVRGPAAKVETAEGKAQCKEAVQCDEADDKGRHFAGEKREEPGHFAGHAVSPPGVFRAAPCRVRGG